MEKIKVNFFLLLILWVQFGSSGFTYYVNSCGASGITSISANYIGCRCNPDIVEWDKHERNETRLTEKCCSSHEHFAQTADDYPTSAFQSQDSQLEGLFEDSPLVEIQENYIGDRVVENYNCNSPPIRNFDIRTFIQSFLI